MSVADGRVQWRWRLDVVLVYVVHRRWELTLFLTLASEREKKVVEI